MARAAAVPAMPPSVLTPAHQRAEVQGWDLTGEECRVWLAEDPAGRLLGVARFTGTWLDDLYVHPAHSGAGVGSALLQLVQGLCPDGFGLWVFVSNTPARAFYARAGLIELGRTDGSQNPERAPEVEMVWRP